MGNSRSYDIPEPNWSDDLKFGHAGESIVAQFLRDIASGSFEVKTDRYRNGRMVVETQQKPHGTDVWVNSGLNTTTAKWWVYQYSLDGSFHVVSVPRLKRYLRLSDKKWNEDTKIMFGTKGDNPAKGFLLYPEDVLDMLTNAKYDDGVQL